MTRPRPAAYTRSSHLFDELRTLLGPVQDMQRRHQQRLGAYRDDNGEVVEGEYASYDDARLETAIEASDALDGFVAQLEALVTSPPQRAFTLALRSSGHEEGNAPWLFVVNGTDADDAYDSLTQLPGFRAWLEDTCPPGSSRDGGGDLIAGQSHPGLRPPGTYIDLRAEQARTQAERTPPRSPQTLPAPPPPVTGRTR
ncbi:hypothetical protein ACFYN0_01210 [Streptomyces sp. NPDC006704]|uniref:hypothetical protein n=1 Tax=Streptomyces sp. NPDC006704 TaxID=3364760 RepID=UPI00367D8491